MSFCVGFVAGGRWRERDARSRRLQPVDALRDVAVADVLLEDAREVLQRLLALAQLLAQCAHLVERVLGQLAAAGGLQRLLELAERQVAEVLLAERAPEQEQRLRLLARV